MSKRLNVLRGSMSRTILVAHPRKILQESRDQKLIERIQRN